VSGFQLEGIGIYSSSDQISSIQFFFFDFLFFLGPKPLSSQQVTNFRKGEHKSLAEKGIFEMYKFIYSRKIGFSSYSYVY